MQSVASAGNLLTGNQTLAQVIQGAKAPAKMAKVIQDYPEIGAILDGYQKGEYHNLTLSQEALQALADATGVSTEVLLTSITAQQGIQGGTNKVLTVIDTHDKLKADSIQTLAHELDHVREGKNETLADLAGLAAKLNTDAATLANQDKINPIKAQLGDGKDANTTLQNQGLLTQNNQTFTDNHEGKEGEWDYSDWYNIGPAFGVSNEYGQYIQSLGNYCANQGGDFARCIEENSDQRKYHPNFRPIRQNDQLLTPVTNEQMLGHYIYGNGRSLTIDQLGVAPLLHSAVKKTGAFGMPGSIESRFTEQIVTKFKAGNKNYTFNSSYNVGSEIGVWAFGSGVISGQFNGTINKLSNGKYRVTGTINYQFSDVFEDPYDTFNWIPGSYDPNGKPYRITGTWSENIDKTLDVNR